MIYKRKQNVFIINYTFNFLITGHETGYFYFIY